MTRPVIEARSLSKRYRIGQRAKYRTLRDTLGGVFSNHKSAAREAADHWALKDVSFTVAPGEVLGVIGLNGAGKTTLLKILSRITTPTSGSGTIRGRVSSLLEVGTGFHQELTGRENVFLNGAILGMGRREIAAKFDRIVDFSGVERFIDTPVKHYSSGMYIRLAFAVAAFLEPDILLIDEVLAVGDMAFQRKCLGKMQDIGRSGRTILFVSHNMAAVKQLCTRVICLDHGRIVLDGRPQQVVDEYYLRSGEHAESVGPDASAADLMQRTDRSGHGGVRVTSVALESGGVRDGRLRSLAEATITVRYRAKDPAARIPWMHATLIVASPRHGNLFCLQPVGESFKNLEPDGAIECQIPRLHLIPGEYMLTILLKDNQGWADWLQNAVKFSVIHDGAHELPTSTSAEWGSALEDNQWRIATAAAEAAT